MEKENINQIKEWINTLTPEDFFYVILKKLKM